MLKSQHYEFNLPELADQYNVEHWNENTRKLDNLMNEMDSHIDIAEGNITDLQTDTTPITNKEIDDIMAK